MKKFHNSFLIERLIKEESVPMTDENLSKVMKELREHRPTDKELVKTDKVLRELIKMAEAELSIAMDKEYYGRQLDALYDAQAYIARLMVKD